MRSHLASVQVLRAAAALLVLFAHLWAPLTHMAGPDAIPNFIAGAAGVDLFFVISGFIMVYASERFFAQPLGPVKFFLRRLARIVPLYWATMTFVLATMPLVHRTLESMDLTRNLVFASYFFIPVDRPSGATAPLHDVGWTLEYEMFFYAIFALCLMLPRRAAVFTACAAMVGMMFLPNVVALPRALRYFATPFLWEFCYGMVIALVYRSGRRLAPWSAASLVAAGALAYLCTCTQVIDGELASRRHLLWGGSAALVLAGCVLTTAEVSMKRWAAMILIGEASYALYLTHTISLDVLGALVGRGLPGSYPYAYAALGVVVALGVAIAVHKYLEQPVTHALNAYLDRRFAAHISTSTMSAEKLLP